MLGLTENIHYYCCKDKDWLTKSWAENKINIIIVLRTEKESPLVDLLSFCACLYKPVYVMDGGQDHQHA